MAYISIYDYDDYKKFIKKWIELSPNKGRGQRSQLAKALNCQTPFITHVLTGDYHLSIEQAEACSRWLGLNQADSEYFVLLVLKQRASTREAQQFFQSQLQKRNDNENVLKKRLKIKEGLTPEDQMLYYSTWQYAAIHMALLNPKFQTIEALINYFQLSRAKVLSILEFLSEAHLIEIKAGLIRVKSPLIHLEKNSPLLPTHHTNWRLKAIDSIKEQKKEDLHYSSVISLSKTDFDWVRSKLALLLEEFADKIKNSDDEKLAALSFDWFEI